MALSNISSIYGHGCCYTNHAPVIHIINILVQYITYGTYLYSVYFNIGKINLKYFIIIFLTVCYKYDYRIVLQDFIILESSVI